ncbi:hypothetical protein ACFQRK_23275 [Parapedobacter sp. GCM10030251]|uniref:hypothetical protein n=1 Tax=Parapedobacter sp. GCM10030251 TaxID=3273419 RepID=UPI00362250DB
MDWIEQNGLLDKELIFVVMEGKEADKAAIESNFGIVAFGGDTNELKHQIVAQVKCFSMESIEERFA